MKALVCLLLAFMAAAARADGDAAVPASGPASVPAAPGAPAAPASAAAGPVAEPVYHYVLGLQYQLGPEAPGAARSSGHVAPVWALRWGRLRLSNAGGSSLMGFGTMVYGPGASADLLGGKDWHVGAALRVDSGRDSNAADSTRGLPGVRRTVRGRVFASWAPAPDLLLSASLSQDLLGRGGGLLGGASADWRLAHDRTSEWTLGAGLGGADAAYMQSYYGVMPAGAAATGLRPYRPSGGLDRAYTALACTRALDRHWITYASVSAGRLLGPAAASPLDARPLGLGVSLRLAYRR